jgi:hypothetical protein
MKTKNDDSGYAEMVWLSTEQLAIATIMSHVAQFEPRAHKSGEVKPFLLFNCYDKTRFDIFPLTMVFFLRSL